MPIAGLVLNLSNDSKLAQDAIEQIGRDDSFTIGEAPKPGRVPVVMDSRDADDSERQLKWLQSLPGLAEVQVVSVDFSDLPDASTAPSTKDHDKGVTSS